MTHRNMLRGAVHYRLHAGCVRVVAGRAIIDPLRCQSGVPDLRLDRERGAHYTLRV